MPALDTSGLAANTMSLAASGILRAGAAIVRETNTTI